MSGRIRQQGFTLVELTVVLTILGLLAAGGLAISASMVEKANYIDTRKQLDVINEAIHNYYTVNGRLPCPAPLTNSILPGAATFGVEGANCAAGGAITGTARDGSVRIGMVPVRSLGLTDSAAQDKFGARILYAVTEALTNSAQFSGSPGAITIRTASGATVTSEAAYTLLSHGKDRRGARIYLTGSATILTCASGTNQLDLENCNNDRIFRDAPFNNGSETANWFDDVILWTPKFHLSALEATSSSLWSSAGEPDPLNMHAIGTDGDPATGSVAIGTINPLRRLHVKGGALMEAEANNHYLSFSNPAATANNRNWVWEDTANSGKLLLRSYLDNGTMEANILAADHATGFVGIGTINPSHKLHVVGGEMIETSANRFLTFSNTAAGANVKNWVWEDSANAGKLFLRTYTDLWALKANILAMNSATGNVGIGDDASASERLYVNGKVRIGSRFYIDPDQPYGTTPGTSIYGRNATNEHLTIYAQNNSSNGASISLAGRTATFWDDGRITYRAAHDSGTDGRPLHQFWRISSAGAASNLVDIKSDARIYSYGGAPQYPSDARLKTLVGNVENPLDKLMQINGIYYRWNEKAYSPDKETVFLGVLAQEVKSVLPEAIKTDENGYFILQSDALIPVLIEAVKELKKENDALKSAIEGKASAQATQQNASAYDPFKDWRLWAMAIATVAASVLLSRKTVSK